MRKNPLGVIGGMGPLATDIFYKYVIENTDASCDQDHIDMIILSHASMPDRTSAILDEKKDILFDELKKDLEILEYAGVKYAIVPCNTFHVVLKEINTLSNIEILNLIEITVKEIYERFGDNSRIGIMATDGTIREGLYHKEIKKHNMIPIDLSKKSQELNMSIIYDCVKKGLPVDLDNINIIQNELIEKNCCCAVLGCTELSVVNNQYDLSDYFIDPMEIAAKKCIKICNGKLK